MPCVALFASLLILAPLQRLLCATHLSSCRQVSARAREGPGRPVTRPWSAVTTGCLPTAILFVSRSLTCNSSRLTLWCVQNRVHRVSCIVYRIVYRAVGGVPVGRPGGMEKPGDDFEQTHNVRVASKDTLFGGVVSRLQVRSGRRS